MNKMGFIESKKWKLQPVRRCCTGKKLRRVVPALEEKNEIIKRIL